MDNVILKSFESHFIVCFTKEKENGREIVNHE